MNNFRLTEIRIKVVCDNCDKESSVHSETYHGWGMNDRLPTIEAISGKCFYCKKKYRVSVNIEDLDGAE